MSFSVFGNKSRLLPAFSKPYPDEILSSWLTRLSFDHGLNNARLLKMLLDKKDTNNWHVDRSFNDEQVAALAAYTNCSPDEIKNTTLLSYENRLYEPQSKSMVPSTWTPKKHTSKKVCPKVHKEHSGLFFCPGCLSRPNRPVYFRKQWRLAISFVCPGCGCYLKETCPHCKSGGSSRCMKLKESLDKTIDEYLLACHQCQEDISQCMAEVAPEQPD
nr:TniQ family protein [Mucilaginibacter sp. L294]